MRARVYINHDRNRSDVVITKLYFLLEAHDFMNSHRFCIVTSLMATASFNIKCSENWVDPYTLTLNTKERGSTTEHNE